MKRPTPTISFGDRAQDEAREMIMAQKAVFLLFVCAKAQV